jgi:hypothetical protein
LSVEDSTVFCGARHLSAVLLEKTHNVWDTISNSVKDVRKAATKVRMLTGTYMLQTLKAKFNQAEVDPTCPICKLETEDPQHLSNSLSSGRMFLLTRH